MAIYTNTKSTSFNPLVDANIMYDMNTEVNLYSNLITYESMYRDTVTSIYQNVFSGIKYNDDDIVHESFFPIQYAIVNFFDSFNTQSMIDFNKALSVTRTLYAKLTSLVDNLHKHPEIINNYPIHIESMPKYTYDEYVPDFIPFNNCIKNVAHEYDMFKSFDDSDVNDYVNSQLSGARKKALKKAVLNNNYESASDMYKYTKYIFKNSNVPVDVRMDESFFDYQRTYIKNEFGNRIKELRRTIGNYEKTLKLLVATLNKYKGMSLGEMANVDTAECSPHNANKFLRYQLDKFVFVVSTYYNVIMAKIDVTTEEIKYNCQMYMNILNIYNVRESNDVYDYCLDVMQELYEFEVDYTYDTIYDIECEASYILNCMESNIILEATGEKKRSIFGKLIDLIKGIFDKFFNKAKNLVDKATWNNDLLDKLDDVDYSDITITCLPLWDSNATPDKVIDKIEAMVDVFKRINKDSTIKNISVDDIIKNERPFNEFSDDKEGYRSMMKTIFTTGDKENYVEKKYSGPNAKIVADNAKAYILGYEDMVKKLQNLKNTITNEYKQAEDQLKIIKESSLPFITIENSFINNTDLALCSNYTLLYEADGDNNANNTPKPDATENKDKPDAKDVKVDADTDKNDEGGRSESLEKGNKQHIDYATCKQNMAKIILDALTTAMTVFETKLIAYQKIVRAILKPATPKQKDAESDDKKKKKEPKADKDKKKDKKSLKDKVKDKVNNALSSKQQKEKDTESDK